jgi:simple sugar transport system permease protein
MATTLTKQPDAEVTAHEVVAKPISPRRRMGAGIALLITGLITFLAWGIGAKNGDAAFDFSNPYDALPHTVARFPGGLVAMILGVMIAAAGAYHLAVGFTRRQMRWVLTLAVLLFVIGFLIWAATGAPANPISVPGLIGQSVTAAIPYILGALAGIICERSGVINVAIEGQMLLGAFAGALFASSAHNLGIGVVAACIGGALIAVLLAVFAIKYLVNQVVLGVVLNTLALGLTNLGYHSIMAGESGANNYNAGGTLNPIRIPGLADIPVIGEALFDANIIVYITYGLIVAVDIGLFRTRWGLRTRAVGEHPKAADTVGIKVNRTRYRNVLIGGLIAGLAGAVLTIGGSGQFNGNISSGKGFIALAAVIFGRWSPRGAVAAALLFGFTDQLQTLLTIVATPVTIPSSFLAMAPYVATVIAVAGLVGRVQAPAADGQPYATS